MDFGNKSITKLEYGNRVISEVWVGNTKVYPNTMVITYSISGATLYYSSGNMLMPDNSNYAYVRGTLIEYHNGVEYSRTLTTLQPEFDYSTMARYFRLSGNYIYFNLEEYGTTDLTEIFGENFTTSIKGVANGVTSNSVYVKVLSNAVVSSNTQYSVRLSGSTHNIPCQSTSITFKTNCSAVTTTTYTSQETSIDVSTDGNISFYLANTLIATTHNNQTFTITAPENTSYSSRILIYRAVYNNVNSVWQINQAARQLVSVELAIDRRSCVDCGACLGNSNPNCPVGSIIIDTNPLTLTSPCIGCDEGCADYFNESCPNEAFYMKEI